MKIELKQQVITWRVLRERYERMKGISGLKGLNLVAAFSHNLNLLRRLYEASEFDVQFPPTPAFREYQEAKTKSLESLSIVEGSGVTKKQVTVNNQLVLALEIDHSSKLVNQYLDELEEQFKEALENRAAESEKYNAMLDEPVPGDFLNFIEINKTDAPDELEAYQACDFFIIKTERS